MSRKQSNILILVILFGVLGKVNAQTEAVSTKLATEYKDIFTHVRSGRSILFKFNDSIGRGVFFKCSTSDSNGWYKVYDLNDNGTGKYIYKSHIQFIDSLPDVSKRELILSVLKRYRTVAKNERDIQNDKAIKEARDYRNLYYFPILPIFSDYFCKHKDAGLLLYFYDTYYLDEGDASEMASITLANVFVCDTATCIAVIRKVKDLAKLEFILSFTQEALKNNTDKQYYQPYIRKLESFIKELNSLRQ